MTTRLPSHDQLSLARLLGIEIGADSFDIAAARLMDAIALSIGYEPAEQSSER